MLHLDKGGIGLSATAPRGQFQRQNLMQSKLVQNKKTQDHKTKNTRRQTANHKIVAPLSGEE